MTLSLFDYRAPVASPKASEQGANLARVSGRIAPAVLGFARAMLERPGAGERQFRAADVAAFVERAGVRCAPASVDRILRELRRGGFVSYVVVNRAASLYRIDGVKAP